MHKCMEIHPQSWLLCLKTSQTKFHCRIRRTICKQQGLFSMLQAHMFHSQELYKPTNPPCSSILPVQRSWAIHNYNGPPLNTCYYITSQSYHRQSIYVKAFHIFISLWLSLWSHKTFKVDILWDSSISYLPDTTEISWNIMKYLRYLQSRPVPSNAVICGGLRASEIYLTPAVKGWQTLTWQRKAKCASMRI